MDEHFSQVGVITRIEAFLNSIDHWRGKDERALPYALHPRGLNMGPARSGETCVLPPDRPVRPGDGRVVARARVRCGADTAYA